jgi:uncharacterized membrane protein
MKRVLSLVLVAILVSIPLFGQTKSGTKKPPVSFSKDIAPLLKQQCLPCHAADSENPSELYLDSHDAVMKGGKHGPSVIAGKPDSSTLILKVKPDPKFGRQMPVMSKSKLTEEEIAILTEWIKQGAKKN